MTWTIQHPGLDTTPPAELSDEQKSAIVACFDANPDCGYKAAARAAGFRLSKEQARAMIVADDELREAVFKSLKLDERSLFRTLGEIAASSDHKDQFRAVTWGLNAIHRWHENQQVEHTGGMEVANPDVSAAIERFTSTVARIAARNGTGPADRELDAGRES